MSDPLRRRNKNTGETAVSNDGGKTWTLESAPAPVEPHKQEDAVGVSGGRMSGRGMGARFVPAMGAREAANLGAGEGMTLGNTANMSAFGAWLAPTNQRTRGRGADSPVMSSDAADDLASTEAQRGTDADIRRAQRDQPLAFHSAQAAGAAVPALVPGGALARVGVGGTRAALATGALLGGVESNAHSRAPTITGRAADTATGAAVGAAAGLAGEKVIAPALQTVGRVVGEALDSTAQGARRMWTPQKLAAGGAERATLKTLRKQAGGLERTAEGAERLGIGKPRAGVVPATVSQHVDDAIAAQEVASVEKDRIAAQLKDVPVYADDVVAAYEAIAAGEGEGAEGQAVRDELRPHIESVRKMADPDGTISFSRLNAERKTLGRHTKFDSGTLKQDIRQKVYGRLNQVMEEAADRATASVPRPGAPMFGPDNLPDETPTMRPPLMAPAPRPAQPPPVPRRPGAPTFGPDTLPDDSPTMRPPPMAPVPPPAAMRPGDLGSKWRAANEDEHIGIQMQTMGENKLNTAANRVISPTDYLSAAGAAAGVGAGGAPLTTAATALGVNRLIRGREHAAFAQALRGTQRGAEMAAGGARSAGRMAAENPTVVGAVTAAQAAALADPKYGNMLSGLDAQERAFRVSVLSQTDPEFRARQRAAASQEDEK